MQLYCVFLGDLLDTGSFDETEYDTIAEIDFDKEIFLSKPVIYLSDLARKDPRVLQRKSYLYLYNVLTVAVFYGLPVVQLVITYQKVIYNTFRNFNSTILIALGVKSNRTTRFVLLQLPVRSSARFSIRF